MNTTPHPRALLSAYLDDAVSPAERASVAAHLTSCGDCRDRLAELRATSRLVAALPDPRPSRRLVPRLARPAPWVAPLRTLSTIASGLSVFLFIASALLANMTGLAGSGTTAAAPAREGAPAASANFGAATTAPKSALDVATASAAAQRTTQSAVPAPGGDASARADVAAQASQHAEVATRTPALGPSPWLWLALALVTGAIAIALQRRLRSA